MAKVAILLNAPASVNRSQFTYLPKGRWILETINIISAKLIIKDPSTLQFDEKAESAELDGVIEGPVTLAIININQKGPVSVYAVSV